MQSKGLDFLQPIWAMIYSDEWLDDDFCLKGLNLSVSNVDVTYTRYVNNYKKDAQTNDKTIDEAVEAKLTPGKKEKINPIRHIVFDIFCTS